MSASFEPSTFDNDSLLQSLDQIGSLSPCGFEHDTECFDVEDRARETPDLSACAAMSTPSPCHDAHQSLSPSPPWQITRKMQPRSQSKRRRSCDPAQHPRKRRKMDTERGNDADDVMSTNTYFMNDYFPRIAQNQNKTIRKDTASVMMANERTMALIDQIMPPLSRRLKHSSFQKVQQQTVNGEDLFGFQFPDFCKRADDQHDDDREENGDGKDDDDNSMNCNHPKERDADSDDNASHFMDIMNEDYGINQVLKGVHSKRSINECGSIPIHRLDKSDVTIDKENLCKLQLIGDGQIARKWLITRFKQFILLIDQHAADERVRVERLTTFLMSEDGPNEHRIQSVKMDAPSLLTVNRCDLDSLRRNERWIKSWGFECIIVRNVEDTESIKVFKTPCIYGTVVKAGALKEMLRNIDSMTTKAIKTYIPKCIETILSSKACRSAVKFGDLLNEKQMKNLLRNLSRCASPFQCAHGRPTMFPIANLSGFAPDKDF